MKSDVKAPFEEDEPVSPCSGAAAERFRGAKAENERAKSVALANI